LSKSRYFAIDRQQVYRRLAARGASGFARATKPEAWRLSRQLPRGMAIASTPLRAKRLRARAVLKNEMHGRESRFRGVTPELKIAHSIEYRFRHCVGILQRNFL
jgi:hypothetical protein